MLKNGRRDYSRGIQLSRANPLRSTIVTRGETRKFYFGGLYIKKKKIWGREAQMLKTHKIPYTILGNFLNFWKACSFTLE